MTIAKLTSINLDHPPTEDLVESDFQEIFGSELDLIPFPSEDPTRPDITLSQQEMTGFSTEISSVDSIAGPVLVTEAVTFPTGIEPPEGDIIRSTWGFQGEEPLGEEALLGTNVGAAIDNAGGTESGIPQSFNVFFSSQVKGVPGAANDFFIIDLIGDDGVEIRPIDSTGKLIGDFSLELKSGPGEPLFDNVNLGDFGIVENFELTASSENLSNLGLSDDVLIDDIPLAGIAFDIEDFEGTGELTSLSGFQITPLNLDDSISSADGSIDILAIGHNSLATTVKSDITTSPFKAKFEAIGKDIFEIKDRKPLIFRDSEDLIDIIGSKVRNRFYSDSNDSLIPDLKNRLLMQRGFKQDLLGWETNSKISPSVFLDHRLERFAAISEDRSAINASCNFAIAYIEDIEQFGIDLGEISDTIETIANSIDGENVFEIAELGIDF